MSSAVKKSMSRAPGRSGRDTEHRESELSELMCYLLHSSEAPHLSQIHRLLKRMVQKDPFSLTRVITEISRTLCTEALQKNDPDFWARIEMLLGYPGAKFADRQFEGNIAPVLAGISESVSSETIAFSHIGEIEHNLICFLIRNTHAAFARLQSSKNLPDQVLDIRSQNQLLAGLCSLEIILGKIKTLNSPAIEERIRSCIRRTSRAFDSKTDC